MDWWEQYNFKARYALAVVTGRSGITCSSSIFIARFISKILRNRWRRIVWRCIVCNMRLKYKVTKRRKRLLCWQQLPYAFCVRPDVAESCRLAGLEAGYIVKMRAESPTLIKELECSDKAEYQSMFRMDVDKIKFLLAKTTPTFCDAI